MPKVGWRKSNIGKIYRREFLMPRSKVVKGGAKSGVLRRFGRYHMYDPHDRRANKDSYPHDSNNQRIILRLQLSFVMINVQ